MPRKEDIGDVKPTRVEFVGDVAVDALPLREALRELVALGQLSASDFAKAFEERVILEVRADNRVINRLERTNGAAAAVIRRFKRGR